MTSSDVANGYNILTSQRASSKSARSHAFPSKGLNDSARWTATPTLLEWSRKEAAMASSQMKWPSAPGEMGTSRQVAWAGQRPGTAAQQALMGDPQTRELALLVDQLHFCRVGTPLTPAPVGSSTHRGLAPLTHGPPRMPAPQTRPSRNETKAMISTASTARAKTAQPSPRMAPLSPRSYLPRGWVHTGEWVVGEQYFADFRKPEEKPVEEKPKTEEVLKRETLIKAFNEIDDDGNGYLEPHELKMVFERAGFNVTDEQITMAMKVLDENGDGHIDIDEFQKLSEMITQSAVDAAKPVKARGRSKSLAANADAGGMLGGMMGDVLLQGMMATVMNADFVKSREENMKHSPTKKSPSRRYAHMRPHPSPRPTPPSLPPTPQRKVSLCLP